ncbi:MAG: glycosyltransferase family 2 protein [Acetobacteraceae bacterium]|nr:glycosyltransferase family 2 protein [Acetobacteraceae bacterium]
MSLRIGVITPAYNVAPFIATAVQSVIAQSYQDWAMLVMDDGSDDNTAEIAASFADPRIRVLRQANAGVSAARNRGIGEAEGDALLFLDADDWLAPDALARLARTLQNADAVAAYGAYAFVAENARPGSPPLSVRSGRFPEGDILEPLLERNLCANGGHLLIRREVVAWAGLFESSIRFGEDWEYWVRLALLGPFAVVPGGSPLLFVRQRGGSAYLRMATDPAAFDPCMDAIFGNPALVSRLGAARCAALRARAEAENRWIVGRELIRHGKRREGLGALRGSFSAKPGVRRAALLAVSHLSPLVPESWRGPFRLYRTE